MAEALEMSPETMRSWLAPPRERGADPNESDPRGRPRVMPPDVRARVRRCYDEHMGQWGPSVLAAWAEREGLGRYSPSTVSRAIADLREAPAPGSAPVRYEVSAANVMWAEDGAGFRDWGRKKELLVLQDECSRYKVNRRLADGPASEVDVHDYLDEAFKKHGAPLVLKHDNGSIFHAASIQDLLAKYQVTELRGPPSYPQYNGKKERSFRDLRGYERALQRRYPWMRLHERIDAAIHDLNDARPRPVLQGRIAREVFEQDRIELPDRQDFIKEVDRTELKLRGEAITRADLDGARRRAVEVVLLRHGLLRLRRSLSTDFAGKIAG
jgi:transposase InsO family protein